MVMYVKDQQGRLLLGKDTAEAGEWMGGFKSHWRCNGDTIHVKYMHKMLHGFKQVKAYGLVLYCMAVFFPTYSLLPSSQKWQFFDCKASATPILNVSTSKKVAWTKMSQTTKPQHFISVKESLITYIHSWVIILNAQSWSWLYNWHLMQLCMQMKSNILLKTLQTVSIDCRLSCYS